MIVTWWQAGNALMLAGTILALTFALLAQRRPVPGHGWFALTMIAVAECEGFWTLENLSTGMSTKIQWAKLEYLGLATATLLFLLFVQAYTGQRPEKYRIRMVLLWILPVASILLAGTNEQHKLIWTSITAPSGPSSAYLLYSYGPAARLLSLYNYILMGWTCYMLVRWARHAQPIYRRQAGVLIAGVAIIAACSLVYVQKWLPAPGLNLLPLAFTGSGALVYLAVFRYHFLLLVPVARAVLVESMVDGVLVIDARGRIVDSNPAAVRFLCTAGTPLAGKLACDVLGDLSQYICTPEPADLAGFEMVAPSDDQVHIEVQAIPLRVHQVNNGTLLVLRDITMKWRAETELRAQLDRNLALQETLREQAVRDSLTGLYNRRFLQESMARELAAASRAGTSMALVVIDLDNFKSVNDRFGHAAGDRVLQAVAALLQTATRTGDVLCRYGGEEFAVVLPTAQVSDALRRAERWRHAVEQLHVEYEGATIQVTLSAGVSAYPACGDDVEEIFREADRALYNAKGRGRNVVSVPSRIAVLAVG